MGNGARSAVRAAIGAMAAFAVVGASPAGAQVADDHRHAGVIPPNQTFLADNSTYTAVGDPLAPGSMEFCGTAAAGNQIDRGFWGTITGTGGPITVSTVTTPSVNTALAVYQPNAPPSLATLLTCNNDSGDPVAPTAAELTFNSVAGATYYVQIGSCATAAPTACAATQGPIHYTVLTNDLSSYAAVGNGARANIGATTDAGEATNCKGTPYGATVWFSYQAPQKGSVSFEISAGPHVITVFRAGGLFDCTTAAAGVGQVVVPNAVRGEPFLVQVGGVISGAAAVESWFNYAAKFTLGQDLDDDGHALDCNDADPNIRPGAVDIPGNGVDEDCVDGDALRRLTSNVEATANRRGRMTRFRARSVPKGATIRLKCSRGGCLRRTSIRAATSGTINLINTLRRRDLRANTTITVNITLPQHIGRVATIKVDRRRRVRVTNASAQ